MPEAGHERHASEPAPEQSSHEAWQAAQVATAPPTSSTNVAFGHCATHAPLETNGVAALVHVRHCVLFGPEHVPHEESHGWHTPCSVVGAGGAGPAYLAKGVQSATHAEPSLENGWVEAQVTQSAAPSPLQVAHVA